MKLSYDLRPNDITGYWEQAAYPSDDDKSTDIPESISADFNKLTAHIETKYTYEYLKLCAYYNKMFPSLRSNSWSRSSYNSVPFTVQNQERDDTGTGISSNFLKQIIGQVVARIGTVSFEPAVIADSPSLEYILYKDETERMLREYIRKNDLNRVATECFHDAAVLGFSHVMLDPVTNALRKCNDWEIGYYEPEFNAGKLKKMLFRDFSFPRTSLEPYLALAGDESLKALADIGDLPGVDFRLYFDCIRKLFSCVVNHKHLFTLPYPHETVQIETFCWDIGVSRVMCTSLFDLLYPTQREMNMALGKKQQLIRLYKGPVPVFSGINDVDPILKNISNGSGECLYIDNPKDVTSLMTVINPTPLDPELSAAVTEYKSDMRELAGLEQINLDMENFRSASAMIALDQTRDAGYQTQLYGLALFVQKILVMAAKNGGTDEVRELLGAAQIEIKPVHVNNPMGNKSESDEAAEPDWFMTATARYVRAVVKGEASFEDMPFTLDPEQVKGLAAQTVIKLEAAGHVCDSLRQWLIEAFVEDVQTGAFDL